MKKYNQRRKFLKKTFTVFLGHALLPPLFEIERFSDLLNLDLVEDGRIGIIGLDTSHCVAFTKIINQSGTNFKVVIAYPYGSRDIISSSSRIPGYINEMKDLNVKIATSIDQLLENVDFVLLETNDGRLHLEQALQVLKAGKRMFIDKPLAASLSDAIAIYNASKKYRVPIFSSSALRFNPSVQDYIKGDAMGSIKGAETYSPAMMEKTHPDLSWYGIHGVEMLFALMGRGCEEVVRVHTRDTDVVVGTWEDGRVGTFRGIRGKVAQDFGGTVFGEKAIAEIIPFHGYEKLIKQILNFFSTGKAPVTPEETLEIYTFIEAADESKKNGGASVNLKAIYEKSNRNAHQY